MAFVFFAPFLIVVSPIPVSYATMWVFGKLIRVEYAYHGEDREADGEPWVPDWRGHRRPPEGKPPERTWRLLLSVPDNVFAAHRCGLAIQDPELDATRPEGAAPGLLAPLPDLVYVAGTLGAWFAYFAGIAANLAAQLA